MNKVEENFGKTEIIVMLFTVGGIILAVIQWFMGRPFWDSAGQAFMFVLTGGLLMLALEGWRTGKLGIKGGDVFRDKNPVAFWAFFAFYIVVSIGFGFAALVFIII